MPAMSEREPSAPITTQILDKPLLVIKYAAAAVVSRIIAVVDRRPETPNHWRKAEIPTKVCRVAPAVSTDAAFFKETNG